MYLSTNYIDKEKFTSMSVWLITLLIAIFGFIYIRDIIVFVLTKLYEFFIQNTALKIG
jgi:hypothetical protein